MSQVKIWIHAVWGTKNRQRILFPEVLKKICAHIITNAKSKNIHIDTINGHEDHIHALMLLQTANSIAMQMQLIKGECSAWANKNKIIPDRLEWADKYFAASVSESKIDIVRQYINNQQVHHARENFGDEYKRFLVSMGFVEEDGNTKESGDDLA